MRDTVDYDLILVMDRYDRQEVEREVGGRCLRSQMLQSC